MAVQTSIYLAGGSFNLFYCQAAASQSFVAATPSKLLFAAENSDPLNLILNSRLTAASAIRCILSFCLPLAAPTSDSVVDILLMKNGSRYCPLASATARATAVSSLQGQAIVDLAASDYFEIQVSASVAIATRFSTDIYTWLQVATF